MQFWKIGKFDRYGDQKDGAENDGDNELLSHNFAFLP